MIQEPDPASEEASLWKSDLEQAFRGLEVRLRKVSSPSSSSPFIEMQPQLLSSKSGLGDHFHVYPFRVVLGASSEVLHLLDPVGRTVRSESLEGGRAGLQQSPLLRAMVSDRLRLCLGVQSSEPAAETGLLSSILPGGEEAVCHRTRQGEGGLELFSTFLKQSNEFSKPQYL